MSLINAFKSNCRWNTFLYERFLTRTHFDTETKGNLKMAYCYFETLTDCYLSTAINDNYNENTSVITFYSHSVIPAVLASERTPPPTPSTLEFSMTFNVLNVFCRHVITIALKEILHKLIFSANFKCWFFNPCCKRQDDYNMYNGQQFCRFLNHFQTPATCCCNHMLCYGNPVHHVTRHWSAHATLPLHVSELLVS